MTEPQQAGYGLEPAPLPRNDPSSARILHDIEKGYNTADLEASVNHAGGKGRKSSDGLEGSKQKKERGAGLTRGDEGEL